MIQQRQSVGDVLDAIDKSIKNGANFNRKYRGNVSIHYGSDELLPLSSDGTGKILVKWGAGAEIAPETLKQPIFKYGETMIQVLNTGWYRL